MCCGNKALTVFAHHVLTDVSGARHVNNIRCSQMRLLPLLLMERIRNLFLKHCIDEAIWEGSAGFHIPLCFPLLNFSFFLYHIPFPILHLGISLLSPACCPLIFLTCCHPHCHPACHQWPFCPSPCLSLSVFHLRVIIFRSRIWWKWICSEGC